MLPHPANDRPHASVRAPEKPDAMANMEYQASLVKGNNCAGSVVIPGAGEDQDLASAREARVAAVLITDPTATASELGCMGDCGW